MYRYRVTLEALSPEAEPATLVFEVANHDNLAAIAERLPTRFGLDASSTQAMVVGAKLLGEVVLKHRTRPPFDALRPALRDFLQAMKHETQPEQS